MVKKEKSRASPDLTLNLYLCNNHNPETHVRLLDVRLMSFLCQKLFFLQNSHFSLTDNPQLWCKNGLSSFSIVGMLDFLVSNIFDVLVVYLNNVYL